MTATSAAALSRSEAPAEGERLEEILSALDNDFLALLGWDWERRVITWPRQHPVIGLPDCPVPGCPLAITVLTRPMCAGCIERWRRTGLLLEEFLLVPKETSRGVGQGPCRVGSCERPRVTVAGQLCLAHHSQHTKTGLIALTLEEFLVHPRVTGYASFGPCEVAACYLDRVGRQAPYCKAHLNRLYQARTTPGFDEAHWRRTDRAICTTREVSLRGLPDRLVAELLYGLWARTQEGFKARPECLRPLYDRLRIYQVQQLAEVTDPAGHGHSREQVTMIRAWQRALSLLNMTPEAERVKDVWDMAVFGYTGHMSFAPVLQEPLREAMKIWVYDDLPRRRNKNAVQHARAIIAAVGMLSESLRVQRQDRGTVPAAWGRSDIVAFTNRMGYFTATGKISPSRRLAFTRFVRRVLLRFRTLGLTAPGQLLEGMPADFAIGPEDMPDEPGDTEAGRDLPEQVLRELCAHLDVLEAMSSIEVRVATELLIDTDGVRTRSTRSRSTAWSRTRTALTSWSTTITRPTGSAAACRSARRRPRSSAASSSASANATPQTPRPGCDCFRAPRPTRRAPSRSWTSPPSTGPGWAPSPTSWCRSWSPKETPASDGWCRSTRPGSSRTPTGTATPSGTPTPVSRSTSSRS
ncbi:hypothetical protein [Streptomyces viridochromogenes]|uniref:hypothetical protein n=1 Tax=Streptomyces viridochromogenes TaxID=1938 RepID=UPI000AC6957E|nr:hypothetical protein [Streptomyces viridochromogenes]